MGHAAEAQKAGRESREGQALEALEATLRLALAVRPGSKAWLRGSCSSTGHGTAAGLAFETTQFVAGEALCPKAWARSGRCWSHFQPRRRRRARERARAVAGSRPCCPGLARRRLAGAPEGHGLASAAPASDPKATSLLMVLAHLRLPLLDCYESESDFQGACI